MAKLILSPLFVVIIVLWPTLLIAVRRDRGWLRAFAVVSCIALAVVTVLSTGAGSSFLERSLKAEYIDEQRCPSDAVIVLSGGYARGEAERDEYLGGESVLRVMKGAELLKRCDSKWMVLSGTTRGGPMGRDGELMREVAVRLGVPDGRIRLESTSTNTREHASYLASTGWFSADAELAIVTSPWHLRRAMMEFARVFPRAYPVMAYSRPSRVGGLMPQVGALDNSTTMLHEYIGYFWYSLLDRFQSDKSSEI